MSIFVMVGSKEPLYKMEMKSRRDDSAHLDEFLLHSALDLVDEMMWTTPVMALKVVDKFNDLLVSAFVTATNIKFLLLHDTKNDDTIKAFFHEVHELYLKLLLNPFYEYDTPIKSERTDTGGSINAHNLAGNAVQVLLAVAGNATAALVDTFWALLNHLHLFELLKDVTDEATAGLLVVLTVHTTAGGATVDLLEGTDTRVLTQVHLTGDRGGTHVVPVWVVWREFLERGGLDDIPPSWEFHLARTLQVVGVRLDEVGGLDVTHAHTTRGLFSVMEAHAHH
ncbi:TPA: hypothetical protein N0F65_003846 [Lagenidium giganteum]|uniref:Trafficking protein particle complex subunit 2 n=1 Tax=Lagenidium giganteum TaxID=4803 RepID=A0AAV2YSZ5_9STRA|nr:TPA: hypothetical protein N0F65_003846 [Lagenidium giganteum]